MNSFIPISYTITSKGKIISVAQPIIMGILNATPNSFYNKGRESDIYGILKKAEKMIEEGAVILDIGGASSKPGEPIIPTEIELERTIYVVETIRKHFPETWLSIDTYHSIVAQEAVFAGAAIVNDISAGLIDNNMLPTVASLQVPFIAMHLQGIPENMQINPTYTDVATEVRNHLLKRLQACKSAGIKDVIIDPGFGFGKTIEHNYQLLNALHSLKILGLPILVGLSRKSMLCKPLAISPENALNGTTALHLFSLLQGANILRVHDVKEAKEVIKLFECIDKNRK